MNTSTRTLHKSPMSRPAAARAARRPDPRQADHRAGDNPQEQGLPGQAPLVTAGGLPSLVYIPVSIWPLTKRLARAGHWGLFTLAEAKAGKPPPAERIAYAPRYALRSALIRWVRGTLGYPVAFVPARARLYLIGTSRSFDVPMHWVLRNT